MSDIKRRLITPIFRVSFPSIFEPSSYGDSEPKYSLSAVWTPSEFSKQDKQRWQAMTDLLNDASLSGFKKPYKSLPSNIKKGLRDGEEKSDLAGYGPGTVFATLSSKMRPGVVKADKDRSPISIDEGNTDEIYAGCYCRASVGVYSYNQKGKGIGLGLYNLMKVKDGERLDTRTDPEADFEDVDDEWLEDSYEDDTPF